MKYIASLPLHTLLSLESGKIYILREIKKSGIHLNKNTIYIIAAVLLVFVIAGTVVNFKGNGTSSTTNPTPSPTPKPTPSITNATSLTFSANVTDQGKTTQYKWAAKNIQANMTVRVSFALKAYIMDTDKKTSWNSTNGGLKWIQANFTNNWNFWSPQWTDYVTNLSNWSGNGTYSYTNTAGQNITLFNISLNPTISASTFKH